MKIITQHGGKGAKMVVYAVKIEVCEDHRKKVCVTSQYKKNPCQNKKCKYHVCYVKTSQSGVEYVIERFLDSEVCEGYKC